MNEVVEKVIATLVVSCLFCLSTVKLLGVMQQGGYKNKAFWRWYRRKDNLQSNRLSVLALCLALSSCVTALCFSFLGTEWALLLSAVPFLALLLVFWKVDGKYALKVKTARTGRLTRLFGIYYFFTALFSYIFIAVLAFLAEWNGSSLYALIAYAPFALMPIFLPVCLCLANATTGVFEESRNKRFVKRAGQVLDESKIVRVAVVGSYGKTSVKNILKVLLAEKYSVIETPASYNTPMGIAKTVCAPAFSGKEIFIAEMGARKRGDIQELCRIVKPDYAIFTGVCAQHIATFGSEEAVLAEKSEVLRCGAKKVICGESLRGKVESPIAAFASDKVEDVRLSAIQTQFVLTLQGKRIEVTTALLGRAAVENISLAAALCEELGMTAEEIAAGIEKLRPVPHRLQLIESGGAYILDDGYNCNIEGAAYALEVLGLFEGRTCVVTPGIVEGGILEEELNERLGALLAEKSLTKVILVGDTLVGAVKRGYLSAGGDEDGVTVAKTLAAAQELLGEWVRSGDAILFLNDLPDVY